MSLATLVLASCSSTRFVPEGQTLLNAVHVEVAGEYKDVNTATLRSYVRQKPNSRWFSVLKLPLYVYSIAGTDTAKWFNRLLQSIGEPPVVFDSAKAVLTQGDLRQQLMNEGFLKADVSMITARHGRKTDVTYFLQPGQPYFIHHVSYQAYDSGISRILQAEDTLHRLLHPGMRLDVNKLDAERKRITALLADSGYFRFNKEYITYIADTTAGSRLVSLTLRVEMLSQNGRPDTLHSRYRIRNIEYTTTDPTQTRLPLRSTVLRECTHLSQGSYYSATGLRNTYNHFGRMQAVRYTNISLTPIPDTTLLDCTIQLQAAKPSTISFQPEGTNTAGDLGAAASLTYQNRNLLRGSEVLSLQFRGAYEAIKGLEGYEGQNFIEYSFETRLQFPRLLIPFVNTHTSSALNSTSELSLLYDLQNRPEFHRRVLSAAWRYRWHRPGANQRFQLDVLDLNYVFMPWISDTFRREYLESETSRNAILRYNYEDLFITKFGVGYSYTSGPVAVKLNVETSGNFLSGVSSLFGAKRDANGHYRIFNIAFAQYVKADIDMTRSWQIDEQNQIVAHMGLGIAYPYGNSNVLPFEKRYFAGGANSVRGWSVRSLGPGNYKEHDGRINFINQTGDMKLDLNLEYRTHLFWKIGAAAFIDAGNVWTLRDYDIQPGGLFKPEKFFSQMAVSYGMGIRLNLGYFILRFDLGMKAVNPAYKTDDEEHYPLLHPRFSRDYAFHFAVGLPF